MKEQCIILAKIFNKPTTTLYKQLLSYWSDITGIKELLIPITTIDTKDGTLYSMNEVLLTIRKLLWNEISINDINEKDRLALISLFLLKQSFINKSDFLALWNIFYSAEIILKEQFP